MALPTPFVCFHELPALEAGQVTEQVAAYWGERSLQVLQLSCHLPRAPELPESLKFSG